MQILKKTVCIGGVTLGEGMPKVCVPVMGRDLSRIEDAAARAAAAGADVIELRIDSLSPMPDAQTAASACRAVRRAAPGIALLFTLRTQRDGGPGSADAEAYEALLEAVCHQKVCDAIDCELSIGDDAFARVVRSAHACGIAVVGSSHEFGRIGEMARAAHWLREQRRLGADIVKAAVMTHSGVEALEAALTMARAGEELDCPMIAIAMGREGILTRLCGACIGSCLTFGTAGEASAPGQIDAAALRSVLEIVDASVRG